MDSVTICNLGLMMVGIPAITSFNEENNNAKICKEFFPVLRDRVLRDHHWSFAQRTIFLQEKNEKSPDDRFPIVCGLPGDVVRIVRLEDDSPYKRVGNDVLVNHLPARLLYTSRVVDPNLFDATFIEALQYLIASEIGLANTRDAGLMNLFRQRYEESLSKARSIDSQENRHAYQNSPGRRSSWIASRR